MWRAVRVHSGSSLRSRSASRAGKQVSGSRGNRFGRGAFVRDAAGDSGASQRRPRTGTIVKAGEEGSTLTRRTARARGGEISGEHRSDTPRGPSVPWMAPSEIGLAPCEAYSPTYLAQALPDTIRLLRKRGAWEMNDHEDIAAQGERVRKILSLVKCLLTGEYPRPSTPERLLCFLSRAYWHPAASTHGTRALFARAAPHARGIAGPRRARFDPVPARPIDPRSTPGGRATRPRVTARGSPAPSRPSTPLRAHNLSFVKL